MGSLRTLNKGKALTARYEVYKAEHGNWVCLDWDSVARTERGGAEDYARRTHGRVSGS